MRESRGRKKPEDNQDLSMALFQVAFLGKCLEWEGEYLEWQECLGSMKFLVIQRSLRIPGMGELGGLQDPEVMVAFQDVAQNPANMSKYQSNPKVMNLISKLLAKFGG